MSENHAEPHYGDRPLPAPKPPVPRTRRGRVLLFTTVIVATALVAGAAANKAFSNPFGYGPGFHGMRGPWGGARLDPAQIEDRADRMVRHLSIELDATNDQQEKLRTVMRGMLKDVLPAREKAEAARRQARELLTQNTIDRGALERLRAEQIALADTVSKRVVQALGDAAETLSPEQRRKLNDRFPAVGSYGPPWRRG